MRPSSSSRRRAGGSPATAVHSPQAQVWRRSASGREATNASHLGRGVGWARRGMGAIGRKPSARTDDRSVPKSSEPVPDIAYYDNGNVRYRGFQLDGEMHG